MGQNIRVTHTDGTSFYLNSYENKSVATKAEYIDEYLVGDKIEVTVDSSICLLFKVGDKITYDVPITFGTTYTKYETREFVLNYLPDVYKNNSRDFEYTLTFEGWLLSLKRCLFLKDENGYANAFFYGKISDFCGVLNANINRVLGANTWNCSVVGTDDTTEQNFAFDGKTCYDVVQELCETFDYAIKLQRNTSNVIQLQFVKPPNSTTDVTYLSYGYGKGLTEIKKKITKQLFSRLYVYGSSENLNAYLTDDGFIKSDKLLLPYNLAEYKTSMPDPSSSGMLRPMIYRFSNIGADSPYINAEVNFATDYTNHKKYIDNIVAIRYVDGGLKGEVFFVHAWVRNIIGTRGYLQLYRRMINGVLRPAAQAGGADDAYNYMRTVDVVFACTPQTSYIQDDSIVAEIGIREAVKVFDDIKVEARYKIALTKTIETQENQSPRFAIHVTKSELPFNIADAAADGATVQITFQSGALSGYTFDVLNDTNNQVTEFTYEGVEYWEIPCLSIVEIAGYAIQTDGTIDFNSPTYKTIPSFAAPEIKGVAGDTILISGIVPTKDMYKKAEYELLEKATEYYKKNVVAKVQYDVSLDPQWLQNYEKYGNKCKIAPGYFVAIEDNDLDANIDKLLIQKVQKSLLNSYEWSIQLSDTSNDKS